MGVRGNLKGWCGWVGGSPLGVRRTLRGAPSTQAAAAVAAAAPADIFLMAGKKNKKIGNAQRAKGTKTNPTAPWAPGHSSSQSVSQSCSHPIANLFGIAFHALSIALWNCFKHAAHAT